jgi:hypothetical protein
MENSAPGGNLRNRGAFRERNSGPDQDSTSSRLKSSVLSLYEKISP